MEIQEITPGEEGLEEEKAGPDPDEETPVEKTLDDELDLMSKEEMRDFAARTLKDRREANAEAIRNRKQAEKAQAELVTIKAGQAKAKREAELAAMEESDRIKAELADSRAEIATEREQRQKLQAQNAIISIATQLKFHDPADAANNIVINTVLKEGQLDYEAVGQQVAALAERSPHLIQQPRKSLAMEQPPGPRTENAGPPIQGLDRLQNTKVKALESEQQRFQEALNKPGQEAALAAAISWRKLRDKDPKVGTGEYMSESLKAAGVEARGD